jgi:hypothetical protein
MYLYSEWQTEPPDGHLFSVSATNPVCSLTQANAAAGMKLLLKTAVQEDISSLGASCQYMNRV